MSKPTLVATTDVKADIGDIEMGKAGEGAGAVDESVITEHKIPLEELAAAIGTDFEKGLTSAGKLMRTVLGSSLFGQPAEMNFRCCLRCQRRCACFLVPTSNLNRFSIATFT